MSPMCGEAPSCVLTNPCGDDPRAEASRTLRRLVRFVASALDVRYAFVSALREGNGAPAGRVALWLGRDYGLRSDFTETDLVPSPSAPAHFDVVTILRRAWPHEPDLAGIELHQTVSLALLGADGRLVGHLGVLDPEGRRIRSAPDHLRHLTRTTAAELERWAATR